MDTYQFINSLPVLTLIALTGMLMHFFKKKIKGETMTEVGRYFMDNAKSTMVAIVSTTLFSVSTYMTLATGQAIDILTFFGIGYMCDSAFNKWE